MYVRLGAVYLSHALVRLLDDLQLAVHVTFEGLDAGVRRLLGPVQHQGPALEESLLRSIALQFAFGLRQIRIVNRTCKSRLFRKKTLNLMKIRMFCCDGKF